MEYQPHEGMEYQPHEGMQIGELEMYRGHAAQSMVPRLSEPERRGHQTANHVCAS
jgi:hypothetical protein